MYKMVCKKCGIDLTFSNISTERDVDNKPIGHCRECGELKLAELKKERFVETYQGNDIYIKDGRYYPYWGCMYSFDLIEDCRARIGASHIAIIPAVFFK